MTAYSYIKTDATTPIIVGPTMLGDVSHQCCVGLHGAYYLKSAEGSQCKAACKRTQQLPKLLRHECWELFRPCWQRCANRCKNSQHCWDLQGIVGRIQPISLCKPCVMSVRGPNNVGRAVQTDPTLLRYASAITEQKKCWELLS